jgi:hypothetical protein
MRLTALTLCASMIALTFAAAPAGAASPPAPALPNAGAAAGAGAGASAGGASAGANSFTAANVDPASPFGSISITGAGAANANMSTFMAGLTASQKTELAGRCGVINDTANSAKYQQNAKDFCKAWQTASLSATPGAAGGAGAAANGDAAGGVAR